MTTISPEEIAGIAKGLSEAQRQSIICARDCGYFYVADVVPGEAWPEGIAQFLTLKTDRLTLLGNQVRAHLAAHLEKGNG